MKIVKKNNEKFFKDLKVGDVFRYTHNPSLIYLKGRNYGDGKEYQINLINGGIIPPIEDEPINLIEGSFVEGE